MSYMSDLTRELLTAYKMNAKYLPHAGEDLVWWKEWANVFHAGLQIMWYADRELSMSAKGKKLMDTMDGLRVPKPGEAFKVWYQSKIDGKWVKLDGDYTRLIAENIAKGICKKKSYLAKALREDEIPKVDRDYRFSMVGWRRHLIVDTPFRKKIKERNAENISA